GAFEMDTGDRGADADHHQDHHQHPGGEDGDGAAGPAQQGAERAQPGPQALRECAAPPPEGAAADAHRSAPRSARYWSTCTACEAPTATGPVSPRIGPRPGTGTGMRTWARTVPPGLEQGSSLQRISTTSPAPRR